jgi:hypothetical protein
MNLMGSYDSELQMFVDPGREPDGARLRFFRWLAERGRLEHTPTGPPGGRFAGPPGDHRPPTRRDAAASS